jgi:hypothetical protein
MNAPIPHRIFSFNGAELRTTRSDDRVRPSLLGKRPRRDRPTTREVTTTTSGGKTPYAWSWAPADGSSLPTGLNILNGSIVGTPMFVGDYDVIVTVTDSESPVIQTSATYTIAITGPPPSLTISQDKRQKNKNQGYLPEPPQK